MKFVIIGVSIPVVSMITACVLYGTVLSSNGSITPFETIGMYAGAMTTTPGYGTALDAAGNVDYAKLYEEESSEEKDRMLKKIDPTGALTQENTPSLGEEQVAAYKEEASSAVSLGYTVAFPMGVLVIVVMISILPKRGISKRDRRIRRGVKEWKRAAVKLHGYVFSCGNRDHCGNYHHSVRAFRQFFAGCGRRRVVGGTYFKLYRPDRACEFQNGYQVAGHHVPDGADIFHGSGRASLWV